jgi:arginyl-tRNA synthetase
MLLDELQAGLAQGDSSPWLVRAMYRPSDDADLALIARTRVDWQQDPEARRVLDALHENELVDRIRIRKSTVLVRLSDSYIEALGVKLVSHDHRTPTERVDGRSYRIYFCDPNATKPLHVGHLRNIALGKAIAGALAFSGADVRCHSTVADFGRNVAEAMAGVQADGATVPPGEKSDHYVGRCYAEYVRRHSSADDRLGGGADAPLGRELLIDGDDADVLLDRLMAGDAAATNLAQTVRGHFLDGHMRTLARLRVDFDGLQFESDLVGEALSLAQRGLARGLFRHDDQGAVVYDTGVAEAPTITLVSSKGVPTQHIRCVALWTATEPEIRNSYTIELCGDEWAAHIACTEPLLSSLMRDNCPQPHPSLHVVHGLVVTRDEKIASSDGTPHTVDALLDWIEGESQRRLTAALPCVRDGRCTVGLDTALIALAAFLMTPRRATHHFDRDALFDPAHSLGWLLTLARHHCHHHTSTATEPALRDPDFRFSVVRAAVMSTLFAAALDSLDFSDLALSASHFLRWFIAESRAGAVATLVDAVIDDLEAMVGVHKVDSSPPSSP